MVSYELVLRVNSDEDCSVDEGDLREFILDVMNNEFYKWGISFELVG